MTKPVWGQRVLEPVETNEVGEEMHHCGHCGTRTVLDVEKYTGTGPREHHCPHCQQRYVLEDEEPDAFDVGEIEVVDEVTGEVVGMTSAGSRTTGPPLPDIADVLEEASQEDLDHLFGIERPESWGSF